MHDKWSTFAQTCSYRGPILLTTSSPFSSSPPPPHIPFHLPRHDNNKLGINIAEAPPTKGTYAIHDYDDDGSWSRRRARWRQPRQGGKDEAVNIATATHSAPKLFAFANVGIFMHQAMDGANQHPRPTKTSLRISTWKARVLATMLVLPIICIML